MRIRLDRPSAALALPVALLAGLALTTHAGAAPPKGPEATVRGTLVHYTLTPKGDVDGFVLSDGTQVHLPPHLSTALVFTARPGEAVAVEGHKAKESPVIEATAVRNEASGHVVTAEGGKHPPPEPGGPARVQGKVQFALHGPKGELNGALLEDGTVLRLPPDEAEEHAERLAPGRTVIAEGPARVTPMGRVIEVKKLE